MLKAKEDHPGIKLLKDNGETIDDLAALKTEDRRDYAMPIVDKFLINDEDLNDPTSH